MLIHSLFPQRRISGRTVLVASLLVGIPVASAQLLSVSPLNNASFEAPVKTDGVQDETITGWTSNSDGSRVENPLTALFSNQFSDNTTNVPDGSQDFVLFRTSTGGLGNAYQAIQGTTGANPIAHILTSDEAAGQTIRVRFRAGRGLLLNTYEDSNMGFTVSLKGGTTFSTHASAAYEKLETTGFGTALNLAKDQWVEVTADFTMPEAPVNGAENLVVAFGLNAANANATSIHLDAVSIELLAAAPALKVTQSGFNAGAFELTVTGFDTNKQYLLKRSAALEQFEPIGTAFTPSGVTAIVTDPSPPASSAFYRVEEAP
ncbi:hypothetical protein OKA05_15100 [Luteolibacter arcticus]|uniref:Uncharacterized protein n=1 Tax=Luteolibacter arcticus TaxID=1581411 RepID=A0ABT3GK50_9BACT|nr:hypothetical protein [Luteolibacter arcticus]MCW1923894.1 hypothetical protein [Luteolibacter arcticus]